MKSESLWTLFAAPFLAVAAPSEKRTVKPPAFFLAGDSTTAIGGGWGDGFLASLRNGAIGVNQGHNGTTTASFVSLGDWQTVMQLVKDNTAKYSCYVTIQFGHNDQKATSNVTISQYQTNLQNLAHQVKSAGATPIILTSLTRRKFTNGTLNDDLADVAAAAKQAAAAVDVALLNLNAASRKYVQAIGPEKADTYNLLEGDRTHLNEHGIAVFGRMVADLIVDWRRPLRSYIAPDPEVSRKLDRGIYV
ncbi:carbohydrate esterase family 12 protein [Parathielavia appendiculata]|uniref:Carbohydrate esterase family 12 protein n=1 Tax=Parathielavia appendiculata TaxID=2587402 RepID=A0AAN6Z0N9_9PEZI|nr:carbohydrate esterase family 12 protein [Parathielavia appendiculata]